MQMQCIISQWFRDKLSTASFLKPASCHHFFVEAHFQIVLEQSSVTDEYLIYIFIQEFFIAFVCYLINFENWSMFFTNLNVDG